MKDKDILGLWNSLVVDEGTMTHESFEAQIIKFYKAVQKQAKRDNVAIPSQKRDLKALGEKD